MIYRDPPVITVKFVEREEGIRFHAYQDSKGVWTIGMGHTGPEVHEGLVWTQAQVDAAAKADLAIAVQRVNWAIGPSMVATLNDYQYSALISFCFNEGEKADWTIWADIRQGDLSDVPDELKKFDIAGGKVVEGLDNRRAAEVALWSGTDPLCRLYPLAA